MFKIGDVVMLKSGGPKMTVEYAFYKTYIGGYYTCIWFSSCDVLRGDFPKDALVPYVDEKVKCDDEL